MVEYYHHRLNVQYTFNAFRKDFWKVGNAEGHPDRSGLSQTALMRVMTPRRNYDFIVSRKVSRAPSRPFCH